MTNFIRKKLLWLISVSLWGIGIVGTFVGDAVLLFGSITMFGLLLLLFCLVRIGIKKHLLWFVSLSLWGIGQLGIVLGLILYPESNLLGGLPLVFGPIYASGMYLVLYCTIRAGVRCTIKKYGKTKSSG